MYCMHCNPVMAGPKADVELLYPLHQPVPIVNFSLPPPSTSPPSLERTSTIHERPALAAAACSSIDPRDSPEQSRPISPIPLLPTASELFMSSNSNDSLLWAYKVIAAAGLRGEVGHLEQALAISSRAPSSPSFDHETGRTAISPASYQVEAAAGVSAILPVAVAEPQPLPLPGAGATPASPNSLYIMLQLLGGPTVQSPERRTPAVCNLISRFKNVEGRRRKNNKETWRARLRRNGVLMTLGKGFATELEAVVCV